jgi:3-oxoacyl-[acyl-carrier-protein] synthase II
VGNRVSHRVAVTGMGVVCPIGRSVDEFRASLFAGRSGIGPITIFDPATLPTRIAAEVKWDGEVMRDRKVSFACAAAAQALADAGRADTAPRGTGRLSLGLGLELFSMDDLAAQRAGHPAPVSVRDRLLYLQTPSDLCVSILAHRYQLTEPPVTYVSACASGTDAIGSAFRMIASGRRRWMMAGGADSMINPLGVAGFCSIGATSTANDDPQRASRPFDLKRAGFVLGEGAGVLILERLEDARARGAMPYAEIAGYGASFDAHGISEPHPEGRGALQAMSRALDEARMEPSDIDSINAHGTGTPKNDAVETLAIKRLLGARASKVPISATKSMIGHLIAAAGAVEAIAAVIGMNASVVHPTVNLDHPDPACDLDYVPHDAREHTQRCVLSNSFAFGGQNASIVFRRADV